MKASVTEQSIMNEKNDINHIIRNGNEYKN